jgi:hypothetical protein
LCWKDLFENKNSLISNTGTLVSETHSNIAEETLRPSTNACPAKQGWQAGRLAGTATLHNFVVQKGNPAQLCCSKGAAIFHRSPYEVGSRPASLAGSR